MHGMGVFGEEEGVQMNSAIDQNLIRYTTPHTVPAKRTSNHRPGYFFIANAKAGASRGWDRYTRRTKWGPRDTHRAGGTRTLILHGSNDPLLSVVPISAEESRSFPGAVGRLSNVYLMIIFMSVSRRKGRRAAGLAQPSLDARLYGAHAPHVHVRPRILL